MTRLRMWKEGQRFVTFSTSRRLTRNLASFSMRKLRERENASFCIRHRYAYVIVNTEDGRRMIFYKQKRGSPLMNNLAAAERWLDQEENDQEV